MVSSESAVRWRRASSHQRRSCVSSGCWPLVASCRSSSSIVAVAVAVQACVVALVGFDDALHQWMAHHVLGLEMGEADAGHIAQYFDDVRQAAPGSAWQIDLGDVAGDHGGGAETDSGEEHLHLLDGGVLALVEDDEAVVQRTAAHVGQRRDLDHLFLDQ